MRALTITMLLVACLATSLAYGDTGTYKIIDYTVTLTPQSDTGRVDIEYYQKWLVESGHIPWVTVGTPNSDFQIKSSGHNVRTIKPDSLGGGGSGVRIDLDKDYQPNQTFEVSFAISQNRLFWADEENYHLDFIPGWYERAFTDKLQINIRCFAPMDKVTAAPKPSEITDDLLTWTRTKLGKGERLSVEIAFPKNVLGKELPEDALKPKGISGLGIFLIVLVVVVVIVIIIIAASSSGGGYGGSGDDDSYTGGRGVYYGGSRGSGTTRRGGGISGRAGRSTGGGGGFGGRVSTCVCACVSCACACACAGGGAAGCAKKTRHSCSACSERRET